MNDDVAVLVERLEAQANAPSEQNVGKWIDFAALYMTEAASTIRALVEENERLRDLFRIDGEQHATRIREMEKAHDARVDKYYEALEAERAKLREAVEVIRIYACDCPGTECHRYDGCGREGRDFIATMEKQP